MRRRSLLPVALALAVALVAAAVASCAGEEVERRTAVEHGRDLFSSTKTSASTLNKFSCATCHLAAPDPADGRILPGYPLAGAVTRPTYWGGRHVDLLRSINDCRYWFMNATAAWKADDEDAEAMYAYLSSLPPALPGPLAFTVVQTAEDLVGGSRGRGEQVFQASCRSCHGEIHSGGGRLRAEIPALPEESVRVLQESYGFTIRDTRLVFVEKVRHGGFLGVFGSMPPFSLEAMSDADLASLLVYLDLYE